MIENHPLTNMIHKLHIVLIKLNYDREAYCVIVKLNKIKLNYDREPSTGNYDSKVGSLCYY